MNYAKSRGTLSINTFKMGKAFDLLDGGGIG